MSNPGNINSLYRTFCTKYTHYAPDGNGRDSYIIKNNGGMCSEGKFYNLTILNNFWNSPTASFHE